MCLSHLCHSHTVGFVVVSQTDKSCQTNSAVPEQDVSLVNNIDNCSTVSLKWYLEVTNNYGKYNTHNDFGTNVLTQQSLTLKLLAQLSEQCLSQRAKFKVEK